MIQGGSLQTGFLRFGDRVAMWAGRGGALLGRLDQTVRGSSGQ